MVVAPEHPAVEQLTTPEQANQVKAYCEKASFKSDRERTEDTKSKTGVFTGAYASNPVNGAQVPIWVMNYVLISYGTGAIMAVPAHDERDFEFATEFGIDIVAVVDPGQHEESTVMQYLRVNSVSTDSARRLTQVSTMGRILRSSKN